MVTLFARSFKVYPGAILRKALRFEKAEDERVTLWCVEAESACAERKNLNSLMARECCYFKVRICIPILLWLIIQRLMTSRQIRERMCSWQNVDVLRPESTEGQLHNEDKELDASTSAEYLICSGRQLISTC